MKIEDLERLVNQGKKAKLALQWLDDITNVSSQAPIVHLGINLYDGTGGGKAASGYLRDANGSIELHILKCIREMAEQDLREVRDNLPGVEF